MNLKLLIILFVASVTIPAQASRPNPDSIKQIKAYCLDFNWAGRKGFAPSGTWKDADPAACVEWHKQVGSNVIQTFCVSSNGWAWYKGGPVPEQPGLKHDFLREVVKLGHAEGMLVMGYFTIGANTRWGQENPELSYGTPSTYHLPYTDEYLAYLSEAIGDAVKTTGIDGFMIDWVWQPKRQSTEGKWIEAEKNLYRQLMGEPFPGEDQLTGEQDLAYSRKAIDRCWQTIKKAAKDANPNVIIWLTSNHLTHKHVVDSDMYREVDWLMAEAGNMAHIEKIRSMIGKDTRLITCLAEWNGQDPTRMVPDAMAANVGLYGFARPRNNAGIIPLDKIFSRQVSELSGDDQNIAVLARAYQRKSLHSVWEDGTFVEPDSPPPFDIRFRRRGRGLQDTARIEHQKQEAIITVRTPYQSGRAQLTRTADRWPKNITIVLGKKKEHDGARIFRIANGTTALAASLDETNRVNSGSMDGGLDLGRPWGEKFALDEKSGSPGKVTLKFETGDEALRITVPPEMTRDNPGSLVFEWAKSAQDRIR
jgi:hypothetical protein